nr:McmL [Thermoactinomyces sp.]
MADKQGEGLFEPLPQIMIRMPLHSIDEYQQISGEESLFNHLPTLVKDPLVGEALYVANPPLYARMQRMDQKNLSPKKRKHILHSLARYALRMSSRPTPFGLFAGMATGKLTEKTEWMVEERAKHRKQARIDMGWLLQWIEELERRREVVKQLTLKTNPTITLSRAKYYVAVTTFNRGQEKEQDNRTYLRATKELETTFALAKQGLPFPLLLEELQVSFPQAPDAKIESFIHKLIEEEFLLTSLRPVLSQTDPLPLLWRQLKSLVGVEEEVESLAKITDGLSNYHQQFIGNDPLSLQPVERAANSLFPVNRLPLHVDLKLTMKEFALHRRVGEEVAAAAECLWRLGVLDRGKPHLHAYHQEFIEKYGTDCEVPVLELLDEHIGLGAPAGYHFPKSHRKEGRKGKISERRDSLLRDLVLTAVRRGDPEIVIDDSIIEELAACSPHMETAPHSMELIAEVLASSPQAIDAGEYLLILSPHMGTLAAGQTFGRFFHLCEPEVQASFVELNREEEESNPHRCYTELRYLPENGRYANVFLCPPVRKRELALNSSTSCVSNEVPLEEIVVGATSERLYLKLKEKEQEVILDVPHSINLATTPNLFRFLSEVSRQQTRDFLPLSLGSIDKWPYLPRLRYRRTILRPARWRLSQSLWEEGISLGEWKAQLANWQQEWSVPRYVYLGEEDQRLLLDLTCDDHLQLLQEELVKRDSVILTEMIGTLQERGVQDPSGQRYMTECVFPLKKKKSATRMASLPPFTGFFRSLSSEEDRVKVPGSEWLYFKLYLPPAEENLFLLHSLTPFMKELARGGWIQDWYFLRYKDPDDHLRVRCTGDPLILAQEVIPRLHKWVTPLVEKREVTRIVLDTYSREIERYGGRELIAAAERVFAVDSQVVAYLLQWERENRSFYPLEVMAAMSTFTLMEQYGLKLSACMQWFERFRGKEKYQSSYRKWKDHLIGWYFPQKQVGQKEKEQLLSLFERRREKVGDYATQWQHHYQRPLTDSRNLKVLASFTHMHCNRLLGTGRQREEEAMALVAHTMVSVKHLQAKEKKV